MNNEQLFFLLLFTSSFTIITYNEFAPDRGYPIGRIFESDTNWLKFLAYGSLIYSIIGSFIQFKWYLVLLGLLAGFSLSFFITIIFKGFTQVLSIVLFIASWIISIINF